MIGFRIGILALLVATAIGLAPATAGPKGQGADNGTAFIGGFSQGGATAGGPVKRRAGAANVGILRVGQGGATAGGPVKRRAGAANVGILRVGQGGATADGQDTSRAIGLGNARSGVPGGILSGGTNLPPGLA